MTHCASIQLKRLIIKSTFLSFVTLILFINTAAGQVGTPFFRNIGEENGLSHSKVNCIVQDKRGFIWFGTEDGLNRYDGKYFTTFKNQPDDATCISGNIINDLYEDRSGIMWIATADGGLTRYNYHLPASQQFKQFKYDIHNVNSIPENNVSKITEDKRGNLWLVTSSNYLVRFSKQSGKFDMPVKKDNNGILSIAMAEQDTLWAGSTDGSILKINTHTLHYKVDSSPHIQSEKHLQVKITAIFKDRNHAMWYESSDKTVYRYKAAVNTYQPVVKIPDLSGNDIASFAEDKAKNIWIACKNTGLVLYNRPENKFISYKHDRLKDGSLVDNHVNAVLVDRSGIVWIGTDNGVSIHDPVYSPFKQYYLPKIGKDITVYDFYKDGQGKLWIATSAGIFIKEPGKEKFEYKKLVYNGQPLAITKFFIDSDNSFYLGTDCTLFKYDRQSNRITLLPNTAACLEKKRMAGSYIASIVRDTIDTHPVLMISSPGNSITYYDLLDKKWVSTDNSAKNGGSGFRENLIKKLYKDKKGMIWLATNMSGLGHWQESTTSVKYFTNDTDNHLSISSNDVYDIQEDRRSNLWISTYGGGLNYFDTGAGKFLHIKESSNLTEGMLVDPKGDVWMICNGHMHVYNPAVKVYSCYDLPNLQKNGGVKGYLYKDNQNNLYAGGVNFYVEWNPAEISKIKNDPDVYFTDFKIFNTSYSHLLNNKIIRLNHDENYFSLEFSAPEFNSNHIHYDYMLVGVDKDWVEAINHNFASYSNLAGGEYKFKVRASNWKGSTVNKYSTITIIIRPPFWQQWWFYALLAIFIAPMVYFLYKYRLNEYLKRQAIRNGIAQDLHDHIGSTLSSISIYSKVAKIYQEQQETDKLSDVLQTIGETCNETITEMSDIVWTINPKNDHMESIVQKIRSYAQPLCHAQDIKFTLYCDHKILKMPLEMSVRKNFFLILKESLNNAIKHSGCKNIEVNIRLNNYYIELHIQDDGIGFNTHLKYQEAPTSLSGNGLVNIKSRVEELNGELSIESDVDKGTKISLIFNNRIFM